MLKILSVNPAIAEKTGYSESELLGHLLSEFIPEKHLLNFQNELKLILNEIGQ